MATYKHFFESIDAFSKSNKGGYLVALDTMVSGIVNAELQNRKDLYKKRQEQAKPNEPTREYHSNLLSEYFRKHEAQNYLNDVVNEIERLFVTHYMVKKDWHKQYSGLIKDLYNLEG